MRMATVYTSPATKALGAYVAVGRFFSSFRIQRISRRVLISAILSGIVLLCAGLFLYQANAQSVFKSTRSGPVVSSGVVYLSEAGQPAEAAVIKEAPMREMHIANNGLMLLRGARVVSVSGDVIRISMEWDSGDFTWMVHVDPNTTFLTSEGERTTMADIQVNDSVTVTGMLTESGAEPTIQARFIRE